MRKITKGSTALRDNGANNKMKEHFSSKSGRQNYLSRSKNIFLDFGKSLSRLLV
ncbi:MAG: hypothetical protein KAI71_06355 [Candidatus Pacebacteria bacterium]|nr:hypothetical protein [Candidatus Paceibacterota bacterium]